jgi:hypothetical protein
LVHSFLTPDCSGPFKPLFTTVAMSAMQRLIVRMVAVATLATVVFWAVVGSGRRGLPWMGASDGTPDGAAVIDDTGGTICQVLTFFNLDTEPLTVPVYRQLFAALPVSIDVVVACESQAAVTKFLESCGAAGVMGGRNLRLINIDQPISCWARDSLIARYNRATWEPANAFSPARADGLFTQRWLNEISLGKLMCQMGLIPGVLENGLAIEGGNVLANARHAFVGGNHVPRGFWGSEHRRWQAALERLCGREFVVLDDGKGRVPWDHLDMYCMPLDEQTVVVGRVVEGPFDLFESCNGIALAWTTLGYRVVRLPLAQTEHELNDSPGKMRKVLTTYTNVLIEDRDGRRRVYMPVYGVDALDREAEMTYRNLGFDVRMINFSSLLPLNGSIRCFVNVLRRSPPLAPHTSVPSVSSTIAVIGRDGSVQHLVAPRADRNPVRGPRS